MSNHDPYQYGQRACLSCGITIHTAPAVIVGQCPRALHLDFGVCDQNHTYCRDCSRNFPKDARAYPLCPCCGAILGSYGGLKVLSDENLRVFRNADSPLYGIGKRTCFFCDAQFFTGSVHTLNALPAAQQTRYYACRAEHIACFTCQDKHGGGQAVCAVAGCGLLLEPYLASSLPLYDFQKDAEPEDDWLEVKYQFSAGKGRIDSADDDYTFYVHDGSDLTELEHKLDAWLEMAAQRSGKRYLLVGKSYDGGWTYMPCRIPFSRQKQLGRVALDDVLSSLDLQQKNDFVRLRSQVLAEVRDKPSPRLLLMPREELFAAFDQLMDYAKDSIHSQGLDSAPLDNPFLLAEALFESQQEWESAEMCHLLIHDYCIIRDIKSTRFYLPAIRYKCGYCCTQRNAFEPAYRYLVWARDILHWNTDEQFHWLPYRVHGAIAAHHQRERQWTEAVASGRQAAAWAEMAEHKAIALYRVSEAYRQMNKPDKAFIAVAEAQQLCGNADISEETKTLVHMAYGLLKSLLEGTSSGVVTLAESINQERNGAGFISTEIRQVLKSTADSYGQWLASGDLSIEAYLQTVSANKDALLQTLAEKLPNERLKIILALLPALGELKQDDAFNQLLEYGLHTAASKNLQEEGLRLKRLGLKLRSMRQEHSAVLQEYAPLAVEVEARHAVSERLAFYAEFVEAYGRSGMYDAGLLELLAKMRKAYLLERNSMPTMEGRIVVRAMHQRYLETAIVALIDVASVSHTPEIWMTSLTEFLELAKGRSLRDYAGGFARMDYQQYLAEHQDYMDSRQVFYRALEDFQDCDAPLRELKTIEVGLKAKYFQGFALAEDEPRFPLDENTAVIHYFFIKECVDPPLGVAVVYCRGVSVITAIPSADEIYTMLALWKQRRFKASPIAHTLYVALLERPLQALASVYPQLFAEQTSVEAIQTIGIIPDDILEELPFEALCQHKNAEGRVLDKYSIFYLHSMAHYGQADKLLSIGCWYGFGDPAHISMQDNVISLPALPQTKQELLEISALLAPICHAELILGEQNTKLDFPGFLQTINPPAILHFAVHGYGDPAVPEQSSIFFSTHRVDGSRIDARLSFREILDLDLRGVSLVVLSACQTAVGKKNVGEGAMALSWAFKAAGAQCVIATRWAVPDEAACRIMPMFYRHLLVNGDAGLSLTLARREFMTNYPDASPIQWAAFLVYQ